MRTACSVRKRAAHDATFIWDHMYLMVGKSPPVRDTALIMLLTLSIAGAWLCATLLFVFAFIKRKSKIIAFTPIRYLGLMSFVLVAMIVSWRGGDDKVWIVFLAGAGIGMAGETVIAFIWDFFFDKKFWIYRGGSLLQGYTSIYNIIPWGSFALMVRALLDTFMVREEILTARVGGLSLWQAFLLFWCGSLLLAIAVRIVWLGMQDRPIHLNEKFSWKLYGLYTAPIFIAIGGVSVLGDIVLLFYALVIMALGYLIEYIYGVLLYQVFTQKDMGACVLWRLLHMRIGYKAWEYQYAKRDGGITSLTSLPYWALGGFYFAFILSYL
ncbi:hypothetical protein A3I42_02855 [Candidatus Uhrbacteria bacterium RIFCSPLOWO2_02_FULL_49_11]|uniref:Uncharacterized protein n=1 Tax=Candidatus Uhrbacteria bacterium RIFCSPLOWO2_02_FULL_49_11 TaxID=1802409 RepID=A0A1F7VAT2_9BACT|nr:MAG: hypothetical protein A3I42_02855 [Candidatus Uhrbacteria bacterium RIFCSPLOWO2_02_FULL_49_11]